MIPTSERFKFDAERSDIPALKEKVRDVPVCLIIPDSDFLLDARVFPFIGVLKVAAELEKNGNPVAVLDLSKYSNPKEIIERFVRASKITTYGITATTPQIPAAVATRDIIKTIRPESTIILGGPHVTLTHAGMVKDKEHDTSGRATHAFVQLTHNFDKLVVGDGELAIFRAIDPTNNNQVIDASSLKNSLFLRRGELDNYLWPARHLIDHDSYIYEIKDDGTSYRAFSVIGQLGCPFECGFCGGRDSQAFRVTRTRTIQNVISEIEEVVIDSEKYKKPFRGVMFYDDELNVSPMNLENLCRGLIDLQQRLGFEMRFRGFIKAELFTREQAELMYKAGFRILLSGVESGSDVILQAMKKHTSREINTKCVKLAHDAGLRFKALMSIGHPGESRRSISESVTWALENLRPGDDIDWTIITEYPGSPYYDRSRFVPDKNAWVYETLINGETQRLWSREIDFSKEAEYYKGIPGSYVAYVWTDNLSPDDLVEGRKSAENITRFCLHLDSLKEVKALHYEHSMGQGLSPNILRYSQSGKPFFD